jgi:protein-disulfide isomerase
MSKADDRRAARAAKVEAEIARQQREQRRRRWVVGGIVVAVVAVILGAGIAIQAARDTTGETPDAAPGAGSGAAAPDAVTGDYGVVVGDPDAPLTIAVYEDLQCPICGNLEAAVGDRLNEAIDAGEVKVEYRMVSFLDAQSENEYSSRALNALLATLDTAGVDAFKTLHDQLYADQPAEGTAGPEDDALVDDAVAAGADEADVRELIESKAYEQWIKNATDAMSQNDVNGTPTVFVDGDRMDGDPAQAILDALGG